MIPASMALFEFESGSIIKEQVTLTSFFFYRAIIPFSSLQYNYMALSVLFRILAQMACRN
jgi:hypothetical protein